MWTQLPLNFFHELGGGQEEGAHRPAGGKVAAQTSLWALLAAAACPTLLYSTAMNLAQIANSS